MSKRQIIAGTVFIVAATLAGSALIASQSAKALKLSPEDYIEIQKLYADYSYALDQRQGERMAADFVDDGSFTGLVMPGRERKPPTAGKEALTSMANRSAGSRHFLSNLLITRTPEGAKASCYFIEFNTKTNPATPGNAGVYEDTLVKTAQGWKFKSRIAWHDTDDLSPFKAKTPPAISEKK